MNKNFPAIILVLTLGISCSSSAGAPKTEKSAAPTTRTAPTRPLAVTVASGPDEPTKATTITTTTTTTVVVIQEPQVIPSDLLFAFDSATLSAEAGPALAAILAAGAGRVVSIQVDGHTDGYGSDTYNQDLSLRRAHAVGDWFVGKGIPATAMTVMGWGETKPVAPNDTPENQAKNRRVEITLRLSR